VTEFPRTKTGIEQFMDHFRDDDNEDDAVRAFMIRQELGDMYPLYKTLREFRRNRGIQARLPYEILIQ
jgi:hypothetical protein